MNVQVDVFSAVVDHGKEHMDIQTCTFIRKPEAATAV
jgi:hypothetical protein